jgi:hypothetical protein
MLSLNGLAAALALRLPRRRLAANELAMIIAKRHRPRKRV